MKKIPIGFTAGNFWFDVEIVKTPGHTTDHTSLLVTTPKGIYAVAGDVFWWLDGKEQKIDPIEGVDQLSLEESRKKVKSLAQFIIPGHGQVFKV